MQQINNKYNKKNIAQKLKMQVLLINNGTITHNTKSGIKRISLNQGGKS